ncbi:hypothetical protein KFK09_003138 [Dendrobium nobile]|uniref:Uncharacterized protein n=1 Tax=Dendrobium nobile TaxID=94219 RepID=A0A8T3C3N3_DENNO|nr:hypothetical protein KFK09_003138 [Dendrobium nobile]
MLNDKAGYTSKVGIREYHEDLNIIYIKQQFGHDVLWIQNMCAEWCSIIFLLSFFT